MPKLHMFHASCDELVRKVGIYFDNKYLVLTPPEKKNSNHKICMEKKHSIHTTFIFIALIIFESLNDRYTWISNVKRVYLLWLLAIIQGPSALSRLHWSFFNDGEEMQKYASLSVSACLSPSWVANQVWSVKCLWVDTINPSYKCVKRD